MWNAPLFSESEMPLLSVNVECPPLVSECEMPQYPKLAPRTIDFDRAAVGKLRVTKQVLEDAGLAIVNS